MHTQYISMDTKKQMYTCAVNMYVHVLPEANWDCERVCAIPYHGNACTPVRVCVSRVCN